MPPLRMCGCSAAWTGIPEVCLPGGGVSPRHKGSKRFAPRRFHARPAPPGNDDATASPLARRSSSHPGPVLVRAYTDLRSFGTSARFADATMTPAYAKGTTLRRADSPMVQRLPSCFLQEATRSHFRPNTRFPTARAGCRSCRRSRGIVESCARMTNRLQDSTSARTAPSRPAPSRYVSVRGGRCSLHANRSTPR